MAVMKIRGGNLDLVEYEFTSFKPGEQIRTLGLDKNYTLSPLQGKVTVPCPSTNSSDRP
jgi:beta-ribofuranosylaminobenzene 5'-phosphate synthase